MALDRIKGRIAFICDECQDGFETDEYELDDAIKVAKSEGWVNVRREDFKFNPPKVAPRAKYFNFCGHCHSNR